MCDGRDLATREPASPTLLSPSSPRPSERPACRLTAPGGGEGRGPGQGSAGPELATSSSSIASPATSGAPRPDFRSRGRPPAVVLAAAPRSRTTYARSGPPRPAARVPCPACRPPVPVPRGERRRSPRPPDRGHRPDSRPGGGHRPRRPRLGQCTSSSRPPRPRRWISLSLILRAVLDAYARPPARVRPSLVSSPTLRRLPRCRTRRLPGPCGMPLPQDMRPAASLAPGDPGERRAGGRNACR